MQEIILSHSNGFSLPCYNELIKSLAPYPVTGVENFGVPEQYYPHKSWEPLLQQLLDHVEARKAAGVEKFIGVGHSLGGVLTVFAAQRYPELFETVIVIDPPIFAPLKKFAIWVSKIFGFADSLIPPAKKTKRRQSKFSSREEARKQWKKRRLFRAFTDQCLTDYVNHGLVPSPDGKGVELAIPVSMELQVFTTNPHRYGNLNLSAPFYFFYSKGNETLQKSDQAWLRKATNAEFIGFDAGHMWPMEAPATVAEHIKRLIEKHQR